jgi:TctA family transporter
MSGGSFSIFLNRPLSAGFILAAIILLAIPAVRGGKKILFSKLAEIEE